MPTHQRFLVWIILSVAPIALCSEKLPFVVLGNKKIQFADSERGLRTLIQQDEFVVRLSSFDRCARMKVAMDPGKTRFLQFIGSQALNWESQERERLSRLFQNIEPRIGKYLPLFPGSIDLIKTTGLEEGHAAYTRGTSIILPSSKLRLPDKSLERLLIHELFHILSRNRKLLRDKLYKSIGFVPCPEYRYHEDGLAQIKLTNPDAPKISHRIALKLDGKEVWAIPTLVSTKQQYDAEERKEFFEYLKFQFRCSPIQQGGARENSIRFCRVEEVQGFFEKVGRNTTYIIHPEEILADNFVLLVLGETNLKNPEIGLQMQEILQNHLKK